MNNLAIETIEIIDNANQLATACHLELVSETQVNSMPGEFSLPGDSNTLSASSLRPQGQRVDVSIAYGNTPLHKAFSGTIEHVDDTEDADKFVYAMDLSNLPQGYPQRNQVSNIYNQVTPLTGYTDVSAYTVLQDICARAGVALGRVDMPDYNIWGNYEVIRKTPVDVAKELCEPFNKFDFLKYVVRCDDNGLQIIAFDYTQGAQVANAHVLAPGSFISKKRSFDIYNPEHRIGPSDVLITGGDIYDVLGGYRGDNVQSGYTSKVFKAINGTTTIIDNANIPNFQTWTETETGIIFLITESKNRVPGSPPNTPPPPLPSLHEDLDSCVADLQIGNLDDIQVKESYVMQTATRTYDSINGLTEETTVANRYIRKVISNSLSVSANNTNPLYQCAVGLPQSFVVKVLLSYSETQTTAFTPCGPYPISLEKKYFTYDATGTLSGTITNTYNNFRGEWVLTDVSTDQGDVQQATSNLIQTYDANRKLGIPSGPGTFSTGLPKTDIGKYQLRNGNPVMPVRLQVTPCPLSEEGDRLKEFTINNAFTMTGPYMDYNGLNLLQSLALREKQLEQNNAYWEVIKLVCPIDSSPIIGESIIVDGSGGIVDDVKTTITDSSAITEATVRRIVYNPAGNVDVPISLAGTYPLRTFTPVYYPPSVFLTIDQQYLNPDISPLNAPQLVQF